MAPIGVPAGMFAFDDNTTRPLQLIETASFSRDADEILSRDEMEVLRDDIGMLRQLGAIIRGTGGLRKMRCATGTKGKRGGARVIYYYGGDHMPIYLIAIYAKSEKDDLSPSDKKKMKGFVEQVQKLHQAKTVLPDLKVVR